MCTLEEMARISRAWIGLFVLLSALLWAQPAAAAAPFDGWTFSGTALTGGEVHLAAAATTVACTPEDVDGGWAAFDPATGLCRSESAVYGVLTSPPVSTSEAFQELVGSWDAVTPPATWIELHARLLQAPGWTGWYSLGIWASDGSAITRHSVANQQDERARVDTDTLIAAAGLPASGYQLAMTLFSTSPLATPTVRVVTAATTADSLPSERANAGVELAVPQRSQMLPQYRGLGFGGGGEAWCSPTSTSMLMAYWSNVLNLPQLNLPVPQVAAGTYDETYHGAGNWPFNTAFAASYGLTSYVARMASFDQVEPWIRAGAPLAISISFRRGQLDGAPIDSSPGHLIVVKGFTADGNVIVNDPAGASDDAVRIVYDRAQLERAWQDGSHGTAYVVYPPGWQTPAN